MFLENRQPDVLKLHFGYKAGLLDSSIKAIEYRQDFS